MVVTKLVSYQCILNESLEQDIKAPGDLQMFCKLGLLEKKVPAK